MSLPTAAAPEEIAVSHCLLDARAEVLDADGAERPYYAASTIKLHVLLAALREAAGGRLDLSRTVPATRTFIGTDGAPFTLGGDHLDPTHPAEGQPVAVRDLLRRMIDRSSNEATDHVVELVGLDAVAATIRALGLRNTRVERLIGDAAALRDGATNETSAADLALTMRAAVTADGLAPGGLRRQRIPVIARALRDGVRWGSKSGWVDGYRHDVAFVGDPDGEDLRLLAVMTAGLAPQQADARIAERVRQLLPDLAV